MSFVRFAIIVGNEVAGTATFDTENPSPVVPRMIAAYRSNPVIVETEEPVAFGWTWDGQNFTAPTE